MAQCPVAVPDTLSRLLKVYGKLREIHRMFDGAALELTTSRAAPLCLENCGKCCLTPFAWGMEVDYLTSSIMGNGGLQHTADMCQSWLTDKVPGVNTYNGQVDSILKQEVLTLMRQPCPFLDNKRCSIYDSRPISCRAYGLTRIPGPECPRPVGRCESESRRAYYAGPGGDKLKEKVQLLVSSLQVHSGFLPMLLFQRIKPGVFKTLVEDGKIASAKLVIGQSVSPAMLWQGQINWRAEHPNN